MRNQIWCEIYSSCRYSKYKY